MTLAIPRADLLGRVEPGDVIFGIAEGGQEKLMLVHETTTSSIFTRHVTTQTEVEFGRDGVSRSTPDGGSCTILSVAPLPPDQYSVVVGLDRKMRLAQFPDGFRLSSEEQRVLLNVPAYFKANPLPK